MFQPQLVLGLFIGLQVITSFMDKTTHANEIAAENQYKAFDLTTFRRLLIGKPDLSITNRMITAFKSHKTTYGNDFPNPEELGTYFEGDLLIPENDEILRNGLLAKSLRWPGGIVPYEIRGNFTAKQSSVIAHAFAEYKAKTCIDFRPRINERNYVSIESNATGCWSAVGRLGGRQRVNLQTPYCVRKYATVMHELGHTLGFLHEQSRYERDAYVRVEKQNVLPGKMKNFAKSTRKLSSGFGVPYDYASIMHYSPTSFSKNDKPTLIALRDTLEAKLMGQRSGFSQGDVDKINAMFRCKK